MSTVGMEAEAGVKGETLSLQNGRQMQIKPTLISIPFWSFWMLSWV